MRSSDIIAPSELAKLTVRSDRAGLTRMLGHLLALTSSALLVWWVEDVLRYPVILLHGIILVFLFAPLHECIHRTAFETPVLNTIVAHACGFVLLLPPAYFRAFHLRHHRHTQDLIFDPELASESNNGIVNYLWRMSGVAYWLERTSSLSRHAFGRVSESYLHGGAASAIVAEARSYLAAYLVLILAFIWLGAQWLLWLWWLPAIIAQPCLRMFLFAEHVGCDRSHDPLRNSRTVSTHALLRWLSWNMSFHCAHHAYAAIPFHALPQAHGLLASQATHHSNGYWRVHWQWLRALNHNPH